MDTITIKNIKPTIMLKKAEHNLKQLVRVLIHNDGEECSGILSAKYGDVILGTTDIFMRSGENLCELFIDEPNAAQKAVFTVTSGEKVTRKSKKLFPPRHMRVHVVHFSHHDLGYTDIPSNVLKEYYKTLDDAIDYAESTAGYDEESKFRIVIEQMWSLDYFLKNAPEDRAKKLIALLKSSQFEVTALFGNMITELCSHEDLLRTVYHSTKLKNDYGISVSSAEHNDIPGFCWGLSRVLTDLGIDIFCPALPLYYGWGEKKYQSFWNTKEIFGFDAPGAFWWEAPTGKRILFWCNNWGCGGDVDSTLPHIEEKLMDFIEKGYPFSNIRWPVIGGMRDNSPYIQGYSDTIRRWNEQWEFPRLISSTNAIFYKDFVNEVPKNLPVWRGELPGQDYPTGTTSTAITTAVHRNNQSGLTIAESLASHSSLHTDYQYQSERLSEAVENLLWYNEHVWGYHFPCGPAALTSEHSKAMCAYRTEAFLSEVRDKALTHIADSLKLQRGELYLLVSNQTSWDKTAPLSVPMREMDSSGSTMRTVSPKEDSEGGDVLKGVLLDYRWHVSPDKDFADGKFRLIDLSENTEVVYDITELEDAFEPEIYAPQRFGLGSGSRRFGFFEDPIILKRNIRFIAKDIPANGYKVYWLKKTDESVVPKTSKNISTSQTTIENEFYRIKADPQKCIITSLYDKTAKRELCDAAEKGFYSLTVRDKNNLNGTGERRTGIKTVKGATYSSFQIEASAYGHPVVRHRITLFAGIKNIYFESSILKDPTPLLNTHLSFKLFAKNPSFSYESALGIVRPVIDYFPNVYSDVISVQSFIRIQDDDYHILWSSLDAPVASLCRIWPGYVSPAHRCLSDDKFRHKPQTAEDYSQNGHIYSQLFNNNFGTNFAVSQTGLCVFRYCLTTGEDKLSDSQAVRWGWQTKTAFSTLFTDRAAPNGKLPAIGQFVQTNNLKTPILNFKKAENGKGFILRLWNFSKNMERVTITFPYLKVKSANLTNPAEEDKKGAKCDISEQAVSVNAPSNEIINIRVCF
jgi:alpha-mannosidase